MKKRVTTAEKLAAEFRAKVAQTKYAIQEKYQRKLQLELRWTVSKGRDTYGYNICTLFVNGIKAAACNGGGYDMQGTSVGNWMATAFPERLYNMVKEPHYGLSFHNPTFNVMEERLEKSDGCFTDKEDEGKTFAELKAAGKIVDLDIHRAWYRGSSKTPTEKHLYGLIDGASGRSSVQKIGETIGLKFEYINTRSKNDTLYTVYDYVKEESVGHPAKEVEHEKA
jgi:hypothetical protein